MIVNQKYTSAALTPEPEKSQFPGDRSAISGVKNVPVFRPDATDYRPKWGLYRGIDKDQPMPMSDDWLEHRGASARKLP